MNGVCPDSSAQYGLRQTLVYTTVNVPFNVTTIVARQNPLRVYLSFQTPSIGGVIRFSPRAAGLSAGYGRQIAGNAVYEIWCDRYADMTTFAWNAYTTNGPGVPLLVEELIMLPSTVGIDKPILSRLNPNSQRQRISRAIESLRKR